DIDEPNGSPLPPTNTNSSSNSSSNSTEGVNYLNFLPHDVLLSIINLTEPGGQKNLKSTNKLFNSVIDVAFSGVKKQESLINKKVCFSSIAISKEQSIIALIDGRRILIFDISEGCLIAQLVNFSLPYHRIAFSPDNKYVAALSY